MQAALILRRLDLQAAIPEQRLFDCVNVILSLHNPGGGWATYENTRSYSWLEVCTEWTELPDFMTSLTARVQPRSTSVLQPSVGSSCSRLSNCSLHLLYVCASRRLCCTSLHQLQGDCSYVEPTSACMHALTDFRHNFPGLPDPACGCCRS